MSAKKRNARSGQRPVARKKRNVNDATTSAALLRIFLDVIVLVFQFQHFATMPEFAFIRVVSRAFSAIWHELSPRDENARISTVWRKPAAKLRKTAASSSPAWRHGDSPSASSPAMPEFASVGVVFRVFSAKWSN